MPEDHPGRELLERFMRGDLDPAGRRAVVRHLLAGCTRCTAVTRPLWAIADYPPAPLSPAPPALTATSETTGGVLHAALHPASYAKVFERVLASSRQRETLFAAERDEAPRSCARLLRLPPARRLAAVQGDRRYQTAALAELLVEKSRRAAPRDPATAVELAETAAAVADRLEIASYGRNVLSTVQARTWAYLGDARRLAGDLPGAERAFARALLPGRAEDPADRAELLGLAASLAADRGRLAHAAGLLDRAIALHRSAGELRRLGRALVQKAVTVACLGGAPGGRPGETAAGLELLGEGIALLDEHADPRLLAYAQHRRAELLIEAGRAGEALLLLQRARLLYARLGDGINLLRLRVLAGRADQALGRPEAAEEILSEARSDLLAAGLGGEAALVTLELALLHQEAGRRERIAPLTGDLVPLLRAGDLPSGAMFALLVLRRAVEMRRATAGGLLLETAAYLVRSRRKRLGAGLCWAG